MDSAIGLPPHAAISSPSQPSGLGDATAHDDYSPSPPSELQPWEQHGGVIHIPRYLYSAHAAPLLQCSGFLITCAFRTFRAFLPESLFSLALRVEREKSATKEAMEILHEFLDVTKSRDGYGIEPKAKRVRTGAYLGLTRQEEPAVTKGHLEPVTQEGRSGQGEERILRDEAQGIDDDCAARNGLEFDRAAPGEDTAVGEFKQQEFHLVKLARNGMVYVSIPTRSPADLVTFMSRVLKDFHTRSRAAPRWCHRIFPVQATCIWSKEDVRSTVVVLVKEFIKTLTFPSDNTLKYAVAVSRRGLEEKEKSGEAEASTVSFGKLACIHAVTEAIQSLTPYISVDLTNPQMVVIVEVLPLVRVETIVCALSVLPRELVVTKPKLVIHALAPPRKQKEKKPSKEDGLQF